MSIDLVYNGLAPRDDFGLPFATIKYSASLDAATATSLVVPAKYPKYKAIIKCESDLEVWVSDSGTAAVPAGATFAATTSEMIPVNGVLCREVYNGDTLSFICATAGADVSVVFYVYE
ncbi:hypothetical protein YTPLAS21_19050 [Candidatus Nitrosocosmicus sp.]|nr:hypothetical protein YTPLAS21_19050 [Candidatus Nitrosocosmicus sp.]